MRYFAFYISILTSLPLFSQCPSLLEDAYKIPLSKQEQNILDFTLTIQEASADQVLYSKGTLELNSNRVFSSGQHPAVSSNKAWCPNNHSPFCTPYQNFDYRRAEALSFTLDERYQLTLIKNPWKEGSLNITMKCEKNFLYASYKHENHLLFFTMSFRKNEF